MKTKLFIAILLIAGAVVAMKWSSFKPKLEIAVRHLRAFSATYLHTGGNELNSGSEPAGGTPDYGATGAKDLSGTPAGSWRESLKAEANKNYDEAIDQVAAYQQQGGDKFLATLRTGWLSYLKQDHAKATASYLAANQLQPNALNPLLGLLNVAQAQKDPTGIKNAAEYILRIEPANYKALMALGGVAYEKKDYNGAFTSYLRVLAYYPEDIDAMSGEAWASYFLGNPQQALQGFKKILSMNPAYPYAQQGYNLTNGNTFNNGLQGGRLTPATGLQPASGLQPAGGL